MPYDARLNDTSLKVRGTQFDFPARALTHFLELLRSDSRLLSPSAHARRVRQALARWRAPERVTRTRIDDETLLRRIRSLQRSKTSQAAALAHLRGSLGLACEATRFAAAWRHSQVLNRD
jgi:formylmethanofuran dehydrogenase subunit A